MKAPLTEEQYESILETWRKAGLQQEHMDAIVPLVQRNHYYHLVPADRDAEHWSRWGGSAWRAGDAPDDFLFLCQIALAELPDSPAREKLPDSGFLYVYVHKRGRDKGLIFHESDAPDSGPDDGSPIALEARAELIFPEYESDEFDDLDMPADVGNLYMDWEEEYMGDSFTRFAEGCRLLGGWTDEGQAIKKTLSSQQREQLDVFLTLDPHETRDVKRSALGQIPLLAQRLYYLLDPSQLAAADFSQPICRYGKPPKG